ncbi:MAG: phosphatidylglycerophosphatase A [Deltaproteobacteria bacterium]|nr:phosphatidylglycerophosphatase A [Deltaproteobacteria bacterium]
MAILLGRAVSLSARSSSRALGQLVVLAMMIAALISRQLKTPGASVDDAHLFAAVIIGAGCTVAMTLWFRSLRLAILATGSTVLGLGIGLASGLGLGLGACAISMVIGLMHGLPLLEALRARASLTEWMADPCSVLSSTLSTVLPRLLWMDLAVAAGAALLTFGPVAFGPVAFGPVAFGPVAYESFASASVASDARLLAGVGFSMFFAHMLAWPALARFMHRVPVEPGAMDAESGDVGWFVRWSPSLFWLYVVGVFFAAGALLRGLGDTATVSVTATTATALAATAATAATSASTIAGPFALILVAVLMLPDPSDPSTKKGALFSGPIGPICLTWLLFLLVAMAVHWALALSIAMPGALVGAIGARSSTAVASGLDDPRCWLLMLAVLSGAVLARPVRWVRMARLAEADLLGSRRARWAGDLATVFGAGYAPLGPGTFGALAAVPAAWGLAQVGAALRVAVLVVILLVSILATRRYLKGTVKALDPSEVVVDEYIGVLIAFAFVPWNWGWGFAAFVLFRIFDMWKPWPVSYFDRRMKNAAGVVLDDVAAGLMAGAILLLLSTFIGGRSL